MFVLTVDQVDSRRNADRVAEVIEAGRSGWAAAALLGPDRTAGDEFQALFGSATAALGGALDLLRRGGWSVGVGVGTVTTPVPGTAREATGPAFVSARAAVTAAKRAPHRFAVAAEAAPRSAEGVQALIDLLLEVRERRSAEGWAATDLLAAGVPQVAIAQRLGISPQAVSLRLRTAGARLELHAVPPLVELLARLDADAAGGL